MTGRGLARRALLADRGQLAADHDHETIGDGREGNPLDATRHPSTIQREIAEGQRRRTGLRLASCGRDQQIGKSGLGERHGNGVRTGKPQQGQHVGQGAAGTALLFRNGDVRQAHLLDRLPEFGRPDALLDVVDDLAATAIREEAVGGLEQHVAGLAVHRPSPQRRPSPRATMPRRTWVVPPWMV